MPLHLLTKKRLANFRSSYFCLISKLNYSALELFGETSRQFGED